MLHRNIIYPRLILCNSIVADMLTEKIMFMHRQSKVTSIVNPDPQIAISAFTVYLKLLY